MTDATGTIMTYEYDEDGNQTSSERTIVKDDVTTIIRNETDYDEEGNVLPSRRYTDGVLIWSSSTEYDANGQI